MNNHPQNFSHAVGSPAAYVAAWRHDFGPKEASVLNRMALWFNLLSRFLNGCRVPLETTDKIGTGTSPLENRTP
jgi:hypothetical protein